MSASLGFVFSGLVPLLLLLCFREQVSQYENIWRISFALGVIVSVVSSHARVMPDQILAANLDLLVQIPHGHVLCREEEFIQKDYHAIPPSDSPVLASATWLCIGLVHLQLHCISFRPLLIDNRVISRRRRHFGQVLWLGDTD